MLDDHFSSRSVVNRSELFSLFCVSFGLTANSKLKNNSCDFEICDTRMLDKSRNVTLCKGKFPLVVVVGGGEAEPAGSD